jgi:hypothetical protein
MMNMNILLSITVIFFVFIIILTPILYSMYIRTQSNNFDIFKSKLKVGSILRTIPEFFESIYHDGFLTQQYIKVVEITDDTVTYIVESPDKRGIFIESKKTTETIEYMFENYELVSED